MTTRELDAQTADRLWAEYARHRDPRTRDAIVHQFQRLAYSIANRFSRRGMESEDLVQIALVGLVKAVDRFDPSTQNRFSTFATPTIMGELRRYFRDHGWNVHVPRGMQELALQVQRLSREMTDRMGRQPTAGELAARLELPEERIQQVLALEQANHLLSLDGEFDSGDGEGPRVLEQSLGREDAALAHAENQVSVNQAMEQLSAPLRQIIRMRFLGELSRRETARRLGLSPLQVSRLERSALAQLRQAFSVH